MRSVYTTSPCGARLAWVSCLVLCVCACDQVEAMQLHDHVLWSLIDTSVLLCNIVRDQDEAMRLHDLALRGRLAEYNGYESATGLWEVCACIAGAAVLVALRSRFAEHCG